MFCCVKVANTFYRKIVWCTAESKPNQKPLKEDLVKCYLCGTLAIILFCRRVFCSAESKLLTLQLYFTAEERCGLRRGNPIKSHLKNILWCCFCGKLAITFFCKRVLCTAESKPLTLQLHFTAEERCGLRGGNLIKSHLKGILWGHVFVEDLQLHCSAEEYYRGETINIAIILCCRRAFRTAKRKPN